MSDSTQRDAIMNAIFQQLREQGSWALLASVQAGIEGLCQSQHGADLLRAFIDVELEENRSIALTRVFLLASGLTEDEAEEEIGAGFRWKRRADTDNDDDINAEDESCL